MKLWGQVCKVYLSLVASSVESSFSGEIYQQLEAKLIAGDLLTAEKDGRSESFVFDLATCVAIAK